MYDALLSFLKEMWNAADEHLLRKNLIKKMESLSLPLEVVGYKDTFYFSRVV